MKYKGLFKPVNNNIKIMLKSSKWKIHSEFSQHFHQIYSVIKISWKFKNICLSNKRILDFMINQKIKLLIKERKFLNNFNKCITPKWKITKFMKQVLLLILLVAQYVWVNNLKALSEIQETIKKPHKNLSHLLMRPLKIKVVLQLIKHQSH